MISKALAKKNLQVGCQACRACSHLWLDIDMPRRVGDRETMLTEAMKFKAKMNDESIKWTEKHNKEVKGLQAKVAEAETNLGIAKGAHKAETDVYKRGYTALQSHVNRRDDKAYRFRNRREGRRRGGRQDYTGSLGVGTGNRKEV